MSNFVDCSCLNFKVRYQQLKKILVSPGVRKRSSFPDHYQGWEKLIVSSLFKFVITEAFFQHHLTGFIFRFHNLPNSLMKGKATCMQTFNLNQYQTFRLSIALKLKISKNTYKIAPQIGCFAVRLFGGGGGGGGGGGSYSYFK